LLKEVISTIPIVHNPDLLVGFDSADDGAVFRLRPDLAIIQTLDFFPPMLDDPYIFGQIAACNALSDIAAMGGNAILALNILAFPEDGDKAYLEALLAGGAAKVAEAGAVLAGGHSIVDATVKYGLSVTGIVAPNSVILNNKCKIGDRIILTKPLGVGIVAAAHAAGEAGKVAFDEAVRHMTALNCHAMNIAKKYSVSAATDVTGFGFLGHLNEMVANYSIIVDSGEIPLISEAYALAREFLVTAGGQKNRNSLSGEVEFHGVSAALQEILFDPQTSGGLLLSVGEAEAANLVAELAENGVNAAVVAHVAERQGKNIYVY
jgi:selenide,water dikinase